MSDFFGGISWCLVLVYPFIVFFGLSVVPLPYIGLFFIALAGLRILLLRSQARKSVLPILLSLVLMLVAAHALLSNDSRALRFYPVAINAVLLLVFATSLFSGTSFVERLARISEPDLQPEAINYTRKVTVVWCLFFALNGLIALYTALFASFEIWAMYNGVIAYGLMGLLFGFEWMFRGKVRKAASGSTD